LTTTISRSDNSGKQRINRFAEIRLALCTAMTQLTRVDRSFGSCAFFAIQRFVPDGCLSHKFRASPSFVDYMLSLAFFRTLATLAAWLQWVGEHRQFARTATGTIAYCLAACSLPADLHHDDTGISLIIPAYNASRYLREAVDSVLNQTVRPAGHCGDDGSTDDTRDIALSYGELLRHHSGERRRRAARNRVWPKQTNPDCFPGRRRSLCAHKLERQLQCLSEHPRRRLYLRGCDFWSPDVPETAEDPKS